MRAIHFLFLMIFSTSISAQVPMGELLGTWQDESLVASFAHDNTYNEIWGLVVDEREYAVLGTTLGTHIIDVTDPTNPEELFVVEGGSVGGSIIHRDFHDYQGHLYSIADEGTQTSLQIIDFTGLPESIEVVYDSQELFTRSHNIFIDESKAKLYSLISNGTSFGYSPMRIFDISDPVDPKLLGSYNSFDGTQISQVHDAYVRNDTAYLNLGPGGFAIVEFADVEDPNVISILSPSEYPQSGYNHSGWLTEDGDYYYMADENFGKDMKVLDLRNLPDIDIPTLFNAESSNSSSIPHNQIVHNNKLYVSYYYDGLQVYDLTDPANPVREMQYPTSTLTATNGLYRGAWGVYPFLPSGNILVSDMQNGLFVIDGDILSDVEEVTKNDHISVSPNPSKGVFTIDFHELGHSAKTITIHSIDGQLIETIRTNALQIALDLEAKMAEGIYSVTVKTEDQINTQKVLITK